MALLPTVAIGMLVAVRRPGNPLGWILLGAASRTLSYALVTGLMVGVYIGVVTLATKVLPFPG